MPVDATKSIATSTVSPSQRDANLNKAVGNEKFSFQQHRQLQKSSNEDYQITASDNSTDIKVGTKGVFSSTSKAFQGHKRQFQNIQTRGSKFVYKAGRGQRYPARRHYLPRDINAVPAIRSSKEEERRHNLSKAYSPRLSKQSSSVKQNIFNSNFKQTNTRERIQSAWNYTKQGQQKAKIALPLHQQLSAGPIQQLTKATDMNTVSMVSGSATNSYVAIAQYDLGLAGRKKSQNLGMTAQYRLQEQRINNLRAIIHNRRSVEQRPKSSNFICSNGARMQSDLNQHINKDIMSAATKEPPASTTSFNHVGRVLRKNESAYVGKAAKWATPANIHGLLGEDESPMPINVTSGSRQLNASRKKQRPGDPPILTSADFESCQPADTTADGGGACTEQKKKMNYASASSFIASSNDAYTMKKDQHYETQASPISQTRPTNAPFINQTMKLAQKQNEDTILSVRVNNKSQKPMKTMPYTETHLKQSRKSQQPGTAHRRFDRRMNKMGTYVQVARHLSAAKQQKKQRQIVLFTNGDQIKLDVPEDGTVSTSQKDIMLAQSSKPQRKVDNLEKTRYDQQKNSAKKWVPISGARHNKTMPSYYVSMRQTPMAKQNDEPNLHQDQNSHANVNAFQTIKNLNLTNFGSRTTNPELELASKSQKFSRAQYNTNQNSQKSAQRRNQPQQNQANRSTSGHFNLLNGTNNEQIEGSLTPQPHLKHNEQCGSSVSQFIPKQTANQKGQKQNVQQKPAEPKTQDVSVQQKQPIQINSSDGKDEVSSEHRFINPCASNPGLEQPHKNLKYATLTSADKPKAAKEFGEHMGSGNLLERNRGHIQEGFNLTMQPNVDTKFQKNNRKKATAPQPDQISQASKSPARSIMSPEPTGQRKFHKNCGSSKHGGDISVNDRLSSNNRSRSYISYRSASVNANNHKQLLKQKKKERVRLQHIQTTRLTHADQMNLNRIKEREAKLNGQKKRWTGFETVCCKSRPAVVGTSAARAYDFTDDLGQNRTFVQPKVNRYFDQGRVYYTASKKKAVKGTAAQDNQMNSPPSRAASRASRRGCYVCSDCKHLKIKNGVVVTDNKYKQHYDQYPKFVPQDVMSASKQSDCALSQHIREAYGRPLSRAASVYSKSSHKFNDDGVMSCRRSCASLCNNTGYKKILQRKFKIDRDLSKYSKELSFKESQRKLDMFNMTRFGKHVVDTREKVIEVSRFNRERDLMKLVDWGECDLYDAYAESRTSRKPFEQILFKYAAMRTPNGDLMYNDVELSYYSQLIQKKDCKDKAPEVQEENRINVISEYFKRSMYTLQGLTKLLKIEFHYERLFKKYEKTQTVETVLMLMTRARKLYQAIEMIITIIKLLEKLKKLEEKHQKKSQSALSRPEQKSLLEQEPSQDKPQTSRKSEDNSPILKQSQDDTQTFKQFEDDAEALKQSEDYPEASKQTEDNPQASIDDPMIKHLKERIRIHIKSFLAQHSLFPIQFKFEGADQLQALKSSFQQQSKKDLALEACGDDNGIINLKVGQSPRVNSTGSQRRSMKKIKRKQKKKQSKPKFTKRTYESKLCSICCKSQRTVTAK